ncbi:hypothetical protein INR49_010171 [Caranx melampygus]|nr:hypothetical protein INR49_010171 [Caranx melampygus]
MLVGVGGPPPPDPPPPLCWRMKKAKREGVLGLGGASPDWSYLVQSRAHDGYEETVVEVVQELVADQRVGHLHYGVAELQGVHEQHE